jgi:hypothetical protein
MKQIYERYANAINSLIAPGMPENKVAIFVGNQVFTESGESDVEKYVNQQLIPWAFMNGIYCNGMIHGNFVVERDYKEPEKVVENKDEDYFLNTDIINYVFAVMATAIEIKKVPEGTVIVVGYCGEADYTYVNRYETVEAFTAEAEEEIKSLNYEEDEEDED